MPQSWWLCGQSRLGFTRTRLTAVGHRRDSQVWPTSRWRHHTGCGFWTAGFPVDQTPLSCALHLRGRRLSSEGRGSTLGGLGGHRAHVAVQWTPCVSETWASGSPGQAVPARSACHTASSVFLPSQWQYRGGPVHLLGGGSLVPRPRAGKWHHRNHELKTELPVSVLGGLVRAEGFQCEPSF